MLFRPRFMFLTRRAAQRQNRRPRSTCNLKFLPLLSTVMNVSFNFEDV